MKPRTSLFAASAESTSASASPVTGLVEKKIFNMGSYTTIGGKGIKQVKVGYETYGTLNGKRDNAILICHFFTSSSHAAGRYSPADAAPGYWDALIGPGKAIDTDKYFVISSDTLVNFNTKDKNVVTTGPASIDPDTGKPYGMTFPIVTIRDFVHVQKALLDSLGIEKLHAVAGPSMGSMQALEWAVAFPDMVERVLAVIPAGVEADPFLIGTLNTMMSPIMSDPAWQGGDYYPGDGPRAGLIAALRVVTLSAYHYGWANETFGRKPADAAADPLQSFDNVFAIEKMLDQVTDMRSRQGDANSLLYLAKACQLYWLGHQGTVADAIGKIKAKVMIMPAKSDLLMFPAYGRKAADLLSAQATEVEYFELEGMGGHMDGVVSIGQAVDAIKAFIN